MSKLSLSLRFWMSCLSITFTFSASSQTDSLTKCACIDSLFVIHDQLIVNHQQRKDEMSEPAQLENGIRFRQLSQDKNRISATCESQLRSDVFCENESKMQERKDEVELILRVIEMNGRHHHD